MTEFSRMSTGLGEECGVFGAYDMDGHDVAPSIYYGLFALQQWDMFVILLPEAPEWKMHSLS